MDIGAWLEKNKDAYEKLKEAKEEEFNIDAKIAFMQTKLSDKYAKGINTIADYNNFIADTTAALEDQGYSYDEIQKRLEELSGQYGYGQFARIKQIQR